MDMASPGYFTSTALRSVEALEGGVESKENVRLKYRLSLSYSNSLSLTCHVTSQVLLENTLAFLGRNGERLRELYREKKRGRKSKL